MSRRFDTILVADWSARRRPSGPKPTGNAIWIALHRDGRAEAPAYFPSRALALAWIADILAGEIAASRRTLAGFDFPFGYPQGFARRLTGRSEGLALWDWLGRAIDDPPDNAHNAFAVAARINVRLGSDAPFWGRLAGITESLPARKPSDGALPEFRHTERLARGAKSCWQLAYAGSVGAQALVGIAGLARLRADPRLAGRLAIWPLETGLALPEAPAVLAEVYPSLLAEEVRAALAALPEDERIPDREQVRVTAAALAALDAGGSLAGLFAGPRGLDEGTRETVAREEAWILGAGDEATLRAAFASPRPRPPVLRDDCFALPPGVDWVPVDEALARLRAALSPVTVVETVPLGGALGRVLAKPVAALRAHPPCANAAVDGYGFARESLGAAPHELPLAGGRAAAGHVHPASVPAGAALRILTGAPLPEGVDTVVLDEDTVKSGGRVAFARAPKRGANTRPAGEDMRAGDPILPAGQVLRPPDLALAAATGHGALPVHRPLRVAVLSTGDELASAGVPAPPNRTYDANRPMLLAVLARWGMEPVDLGIAPDDEGAVARALDRGAAEADAILTSGGASAGDEDHLSRLLRSRGRVDTWRVAVKPGRPLALGFWRDTPIFGLPGNPVAALVCTLVFARPALRVLAGAPWTEPAGRMLPAAFTKAKKSGRREYLRARPTADGRVEVFRSEGSGRVSGLAWAEGLVELPDGALTIAEGDPVRYLAYTDFGL